MIAARIAGWQSFFCGGGDGCGMVLFLEKLKIFRVSCLL